MACIERVCLAGHAQREREREREREMGERERGTSQQNVTCKREKRELRHSTSTTYAGVYSDFYVYDSMYSTTLSSSGQGQPFDPPHRLHRCPLGAGRTSFLSVVVEAGFFADAAGLGRGTRRSRLLIIVRGSAPPTTPPSPRVRRRRLGHVGEEVVPERGDSGGFEREERRRRTA